MKWNSIHKLGADMRNSKRTLQRSSDYIRYVNPHTQKRNKLAQRRTYTNTHVTSDVKRMLHQTFTANSSNTPPNSLTLKPNMFRYNRRLAQRKPKSQFKILG